MALRYLLDTNAVSDIIREPSGAVASRAESAGESCLCCSVIVACELRCGAAKRGSARLSRLVEIALDKLEVLPLSPPADRLYAALRHRLSTAGTIIGPNDLYIAAHALASDLVLVTANVDEFRRVDGLVVESWRTDGDS